MGMIMNTERNERHCADLSFREKVEKLGSDTLARSRHLMLSLRCVVRPVLEDVSGGAFVFFGITMMGIMGFAAMGVDLVALYAERRLTQTIADAAAVGGTYADLSGGDFAAVEAAALADAQRNGFDTSADTLAVSLSGPLAQASTVVPRVDVTVTRRIGLKFMGLFTEGNTVLVAARSVGGMRGLGPLCVIALNETANGALTFSGSTNADIGCGVASNSSATDAILISGNAQLAANPAQAYGDIEVSGSGQLISELPPLPHMPRVADPYAGRSFPGTPGGCDSMGVTLHPSDNLTLDADGGSYRICGDLDVSGDLTLLPGVYYVDDGDVTFGSISTITGADVTIVITGSAPANVGDIRINGGTTVDLRAPATGPFRGIVIYKDQNASPGDDRLNGGSTMNLRGVVYMPSQPIQFNGGADQDGCTEIVADTVTFIGNSNIRNTPALCQAVGLTDSVSPTQQQVVLVQ